MTSIYSQSIGGSVVFGAICKDGIVVCSESRASIKDRDDNIVAFFDEMKKIFIKGDFILAFTGNVIVDDFSVAKYVDSFDPSAATSPTILLKEFHNYIVDDIGLERYNKLFKSIKIVAAGFDKNAPQICALVGDEITCANEERIILGIEGKSGFPAVYFSQLTIKEALKPIDKKLKEFSKSSTKHDIGGPTAAYILKKGKTPKCLKNCLGTTWRNSKEMKIFFKSNLKKIKPVPPNTIEQVIALLSI